METKKTKKVKYYQIDGYSTRFDTLSAAKTHFRFWTLKEQIAEIGTPIVGYDYSCNPVTYCYLKRVDKNGRLYFSKSFKYTHWHVTQ